MSTCLEIYITANYNHICDRNCNMRILYDNHSSLCRVIPLSLVEEKAVGGIKRKLKVENSNGCTFKHN
ncbi:hypothetical protein IEQ34_009096 [Dendrobium chrysotoxum]|uniref:Uncharacterized protein n=1 Tax=Dendrobium chrysotoxum TaxID=161865 RepID=A0AAV7GXN1_DENCH|nr:hypothetical protein IEQ34_009096 [Dendrobium chrysotoxum]